MNKELKSRVDKMFKMTKAKFISSRILCKGKFIDLFEDKYLLPNKIVMNRERIVKNDGKSAVIVIAKTTYNKYILVSQNRVKGIVTLEFPSGYVETDEKVSEAAKRELLEETGYTSSNIEVIDKCYNSLSIDGTIIYIVLMREAIKIDNQHLGKYEYINVETFDFKELEELIEYNYINGIGNKLAFYELKNIVNNV